MSRSTVLVGLDSETEHRQLLDESLTRLKARGVTAAAYLAHGEVGDVTLHYAKELKIGLIVVGQYPTEGRSRWWITRKRASLSEHSPFSIFISMGG